LVSVPPTNLNAVLNAAEHAGVPVSRLGLASGDRLQVKGLLDVELSAARAAWRDHIPAALGTGATH
jgi:hypothetical protein